MLIVLVMPIVPIMPIMLLARIVRIVRIVVLVILWKGRRSVAKRVKAVEVEILRRLLLKTRHRQARIEVRDAVADPLAFLPGFFSLFFILRRLLLKTGLVRQNRSALPRAPAGALVLLLSLFLAEVGLEVSQVIERRGEGHVRLGLVVAGVEVVRVRPGVVHRVRCGPVGVQQRFRCRIRGWMGFRSTRLRVWSYGAGVQEVFIRLDVHLAAFASQRRIQRRIQRLPTWICGQMAAISLDFSPQTSTYS
mmetsp:Transcript_8818/g.33272  ORF Transcript_8818/g.33272 Transcript_8818/m.33272 type:complete len:249 (+) Transcript_8818:1224-1970(+)